MSYIYSDLKRSARITAAFRYYHTYREFLKYMQTKDEPDWKPNSWYIDDRANPGDFWALMSIAHPEYCSEHKKVSKNKIKRGIDLIFADVSIIKSFQECSKADENFERTAWFLEVE